MFLSLWSLLLDQGSVQTIGRHILSRDLYPCEPLGRGCLSFHLLVPLPRVMAAELVPTVKTCTVVTRSILHHGKNYRDKFCSTRRVVVLDINMLKCYFDVPLQDAAKSLGVCSTALKRYFKVNRPYFQDSKEWLLLLLTQGVPKIGNQALAIPAGWSQFRFEVTKPWNDQIFDDSTG